MDSQSEELQCKKVLSYLILCDVVANTLSTLSAAHETDKTKMTNIVYNTVTKNMKSKA